MAVTISRNMSAKKLLMDALERVESASIREWAGTDQNGPIWLEIARKCFDKNGGGEDAVLKLSTYIVCVAIGA